MNQALSACFALVAQAFAQCAAIPAIAADVMPVWQNDTAANTMSFNDTFGHQVSIGTYNPATGTWTIAAGSGVASLTWTGGLVSIANPTTTPAFTVAGTSGGIPYFSSGTTWASSAALGANQLVVGGGAGVAPSTPSGLGTTTQVLHGNASGPPTFAAIASADVAAVLASPPCIGCTVPGSVAASALTLSSNTKYSQPVLNNVGLEFPSPVFDIAAFGAIGKASAYVSPSTVTMTIANPAVVTWTGSNLVAGQPIAFSTTGTLPTGVTAGTVYYVLPTALTANTFEFAATVGGSAIITTGTQTGAHIAVSSAASVSITSPGIVTWNNHGLSCGQPVSFSLPSGGALPTGLTVNTVYYVLSAGLTANTFEISATSGCVGTPVNTSGTQSGIAALSTNDTAAVQAAFTAASVVPNGRVQAGCGAFTLTSPISANVMSSQNLTLYGEGQDCTRFAFQGAASTGFTFTYGNNFSSVNVHNLTITTDQAGAASGVAIHLLSTTANPNPALAPNNIIEGVTIIGSDLYTSPSYANYWLKGIWIDDVSSTTITNGTFVGPKTNGGKMLVLNGNASAGTYATATQLSDDIFAACGSCIEIDSYYQGMSITGSNFTGGQYAISVPVSQTGSLDELVIAASQFGYFTGTGIINLLTMVQDVHITGSEFDIQPNSSGINGSMTLFSIEGGAFYAPNSTGTIGIHLTYGGGSGAASGNNSGTIQTKFHDLITGIALDANTTATLGHNSYTAVTTPVLNNSANTVWTTLGDIAAQSAPAGYVGEVISCNVPIGSPVSLSTGVAKTICNVSLTPGDWSCEGNGSDLPAAGTTTSFFVISISPTNNTLGTTPGYTSLPYAAPAASVVAAPTGQQILRLTTTTPEYLVMFVNFATSTMTGFGNLSCTRFM